MMFLYPEHSAAIRQKLELGAPLVVCMCTMRCFKCHDWWGELRTLTKLFPEVCFVWLDVDEFPDMVADIPGLDSFPFVLVRSDVVRVLRPVEPDVVSFEALLRRELVDCLPMPTPIAEPGLYSFLLE